MARTVLPLLGAADARTADAAAIAAGDPAHVLMARAAGHLARTVIASAGRAAGLRVDIVVGQGDNGGDGWAAAPLLVARGACVRVIARSDTPAPRSDAAARARQRWITAGGTVRTQAPAEVLVDGRGRARADVVVDCLLGTGASGALRGFVAEAAAAINAARAGGARVVACDVPSGVHADDGTVAQGAVIADVTVTFGALKRGLLLAPASARCGQLQFGALGERFADAAADLSANADHPWWTLTAEGARPDRIPPFDEKRRRGVVVVVAGRVGAAGAAVLAGRGALAAGAGLVTVAVPEPIRAEVAAQHPALMTVGLPADADGAVHPDAVHALPLAGADAVVVGPGLGTGRGAAAVVAMLRRTQPRLVLDADALNVHRETPDDLQDHPRTATLVLTPHLRELDRIGGEGTYEDRAARVPELAIRWGAHIVAKGPGTLSAAPDGTVYVSPFSVPALATAGTGDVLAGMLGATLAARSPDPAHAVARTVWWHAAAGILAGSRAGGRTDATGLLRALPDLFAQLDVAVRRPRTVVDPGPYGRTVLAELFATEREGTR